MKIYLRGGRADLACPLATKKLGHLSAQFVWQAGSEHFEHHAVELTCPCGRPLVHIGGSDPWVHPHVEIEGEPHGA